MVASIKELLPVLARFKASVDPTSLEILETAIRRHEYLETLLPSDYSTGDKVAEAKLVLAEIEDSLRGIEAMIDELKTID
jgi:hypothetical protein